MAKRRWLFPVKSHFYKLCHCQWCGVGLCLRQEVPELLAPSSSFTESSRFQEAQTGFRFKERNRTFHKIRGESQRPVYAWGLSQSPAVSSRSKVYYCTSAAALNKFLQRKWKDSYYLPTMVTKKFALCRNSSLLSIASSLIFSRPCLSCHTTDRKAPSKELVQMQWILLLLQFSLSQWKFAVMEPMENPVTFSSPALPFAHCSPHWVHSEGLIPHQEGKTPSQRAEQRGWDKGSPSVMVISSIRTAHLLRERCWARSWTSVGRKQRVRWHEELTG